MLRAGWAVTYDQSGAEYGPYTKEYFLEIQKKAESVQICSPNFGSYSLIPLRRAARIGIWQKGPLKETPAEYKKRYATGALMKDDAAAVVEGGLGKQTKKARTGVSVIGILKKLTPRRHSTSSKRSKRSR
jgi:hypothetical protein